jgi:hypothetical protein
MRSLLPVHRIHAANARRGLTLSEVLVSVLVMSIGVVSLMSLFPISTLRALQATNLTNATNLRYNVEGLVAARPELGAGARRWKSGLAVPVNTFIVPNNSDVRAAFPRIMFEATGGGNTGTSEPNWLLTPPISDGTVDWTPRTVNGFFIDPIGAWDMDAFANSTSFVGNDGAAAFTFHRRFAALGIQGQDAVTAEDSRRLARFVATLPDSWVLLTESTQVAGFTNAQVSAGTVSTVSISGYSEPIDTTLVTTAGIQPLRATIYDAESRVSHTRIVTAITGAGTTQTLTFDRVLPAGFAPAKVRIDQKEQRYTFLVSCRRLATGTLHRDVVVFFRRRFDPSDERLFPAAFISGTDPGLDAQPGFAGTDDDNNGTADDATELGWLGSDDEPVNYAIVGYTAGPNSASPYLKKGAFVCDYAQLHWYKILDFTSPAASVATLDPSPGFAPAFVGLPQFGLGANQFVRLKLARAVVDSNSTNQYPAAVRGAMFPRNVVEVFPIGTPAIWEGGDL